MPAEVLAGLWRFESVHPEWEDETDGWEPEVAWWAIATEPGLVLVDPLALEWEALDDLVAAHGGCAAIVRTTYWHQRTIAEAAVRYRTEVWARAPAPGVRHEPFDRELADRGRLPGDLVAHHTSRDDELSVWLPRHRALVFGDVMLRTREGRLQMCPESWLSRDGGREPLRAALAPLTGLGVEHVLVSHGPLVLGDAPTALASALAA
jgi:hypothetical protein